MRLEDAKSQCCRSMDVCAMRRVAALLRCPGPWRCLRIAEALLARKTGSLMPSMHALGRSERTADSSDVIAASAIATENAAVVVRSKPFRTDWLGQSVKFVMQIRV